MIPQFTILTDVLNLAWRRALIIMGAPWTTCLSISVIWILYRVFLVFDKPVDELEEALGIDVPPVPEISLSSITKDAVLLYWKPPDAYHSPLHQDIQVNGVNVEDVEYANGSVQVTGLQPGRSYVIRAVSTNHAGNSTYSRLIQVQTIAEQGNVGVKRLADSDQYPTKRRISGRRMSQPMPIHEAMVMPVIQDPDTGAPDQTISQLNERLSKLRQDKNALELDLQNESNETENAELELSQRRDALRQQVEAQEKEHQDKRRQVNELEKNLKTAQRRKQNKDQILRQKRSERQKMQDDIAVWKSNEADTHTKSEDLRTQNLAMAESFESGIQELDETYKAAMAENKILEEQLRTWGTKVSEFKNNARAMQDEEQHKAFQREQEYSDRIQQITDDARRVYKEQQEQNTDISKLREMHTAIVYDRQQNPEMYRTYPHIDYTRTARHSTAVSRAIGGHPNLDPSANSFHAPPFAIKNRPALAITDMPGHEDLDPTGGATLSPGAATNLLPSSLLNRIEEPLSFPTTTQYYGIEPMENRNTWEQDPQSPSSMHSQYQSAMNSPHQSHVSIPRYDSIDADHQSLRSTGSPYGSGLTATAPGGLGSKWFGLASRRKPSEGPALGTLKTSQSQSFPINEPDSANRKKNGNIWSPMNVFTRGGSGVPEDDSALAAIARKKRGMLDAKLEPAVFDAFDRSSSPRAASSSSRDFLPRPSSDSNPWTSDGLRQRIIPLGGGWEPSSWSAAHSRRQSVQHPSTSNLSLGTIPTDIDGQPFRQPAPIGAERKNLKTKPKLNPAAPSFNFKVFGKTKPAKDGAEQEVAESTKVKTKSKTKSTKKKDKTKEIKHVESVDSLNNLSEDGPRSHTSPRLSRDTHTYSQDDESQSSMLEATSSQGDSQLLATPTSAVTPSKESLIQKIQRKGSSKNFGASLSWKDRSFFSKKPSGEPLTPGDIGEDTSDYLTRDVMGDANGTPSTPVLDGQKSSRLGSSAFGRLIGKGKPKADKEERERSSLEADSSNDE